MDNKDRERLMLSTGIVLVGYAIIFLLLMGLKWPPLVPFRTISAPVSVYVNLQGTALADTVRRPAAPPPVLAKQAPPKQQVQAPAEPKAASAQGTTVAPTAPSAGAAPASQKSTNAAGQQPAAPVPSQATAIPSRPNIPTSMTSSAGPSSAGASSATAPPKGGPATGPQSATPGANYSANNQANAAPPQGSGGSGAQQNEGQSQTYYGPPGSTNGGSNGGFFNTDLAAAAGASSASSSTASAGTQGSASSTAGGKTSGAAGGSTGGGGNGVAGSGTGGASSSSGPTIDWKGASAARKVAVEPPPLVIPRQYLAEIPPSINVSISFEVTPFGIVRALNVTPSTGYPGLDNLLKQWMDKWQFEPVAGNQAAQGTLQYVIQATTAR